MVAPIIPGTFNKVVSNATLAFIGADEINNQPTVPTIGSGVLYVGSYVWDPVGLAWVKMTQPGGGGGGGNAAASATGAAVPASADYVGYNSAGLLTGVSTATPLPVAQQGNVNVGNFPATQPVSIATMPSTPVTGTFWQVTQPVSLASMPTTPVKPDGSLWSLTGTSANVNVTNASITVNGTFFQATQPVSGTFFQATQPVSIASMPSTPVTGTFWQTTQPVSLASLPSLAAGANTIGTINVGTLPAITKGTQGTTGVAVQELKDAGRVYKVFYLDAITGITTEALATMNINSGGTVTTGTSYTVTAGKTLRIQSFAATVKDSTTTAIYGRIRVRSAATVSATVGIVASVDIGTTTGTALAGAGSSERFSIPDGLEIAGGQQIGISHIESATTSTVSCCLIGYEY